MKDTASPHTVGPREMQLVEMKGRVTRCVGKFSVAAAKLCAIV